MNTYLFDTEKKRAIRHSNMLLECIAREKQAKLKQQSYENSHFI